MSDYWSQYGGKTVPLKELLQWLSHEHNHVTDDEGELLEGWDFPVVNSMALHRWATEQADPVEYEYAVQMDSSMDERDPFTLPQHFPDRYALGEYWGEQDERQHNLDWLCETFTNSTFWLVRRRKAGKVERV